MKRNDPRTDPALLRLVQGLQQALGPRLRSVVLYGSAARDDYHPAASDLNVIVVLDELDAAACEALSPAVRRFVRKGHAIPRMFSPALIAASADTFPIEFLDIRDGRVVLHGADPFAQVVVEKDDLRLQIEREIKERLMRLREAYVMVHDRRSPLRRLLVQSYPAFVALFRGGLNWMGRPVPARAADVVAAFCLAADLDQAPFDDVARLRRGERVTQNLKTIFGRYHEQITRAAESVDRLRIL